MDGVLYRGDEPVPGAKEAVERLRARGIRIVFCTNNSTAAVEDYVAKLTGMGITATAEDVLTSAVVTARVLEERGFRGRRAIVVGGRGLRAGLESVGLAIVDDPDVTAADIVVVGLDTSFDYAALRRAADAVRAGARFVATNDDATLPAAGGIWPGAGSIVAAIETAAGRRAEVMGKPHAPMMDSVAARLAGAAHIAAVGDRPETDLAGASERGWTTVLVFSGVTSAADARRLDPPPDLILDSIADL
ncbi:MAG: HAD-IIA family hydrolase [Actinomycetota bacterium]